MTDSSNSHPVVGIGASAGGLEALEEFFDAMPPDSGMSFVVVTHLHPGHRSLLPQLIGRHTEMPVVAIEDDVRVERNAIDVVVTDVVMPGQLGTQLARELREKGTPVPILFMSAHPREELIENAGLGVRDEVIEKPFDRDTLGRRLRGMFARRAI
jgi:two-component system CheB/CheR fusion protein